jgi:hypothetical protein
MGELGGRDVRSRVLLRVRAGNLPGKERFALRSGLNERREYWRRPGRLEATIRTKQTVAPFQGLWISVQGKVVLDTSATRGTDELRPGFLVAVKKTAASR